MNDAAKKIAITGIIGCLAAVSSVGAEPQYPDYPQSVTIVLDDFEQADAPLKWKADEQSLEIQPDAETGSRVLAAHIQYRSKPVDMVIPLPQPIALHKIKSVSFKYKTATDQLTPHQPVTCSLLTGGKNYPDVGFVVDTKGGFQTNIWLIATVPIAHPLAFPSKPVKINQFELVNSLKLRLNAPAGTETNFDFFLDDVVIELKEPEGLDYKPRVSELAAKPPPYRVLLVKHTQSCLHNVAELLQSFNVPVETDTCEFLGIHLPLAGFPATRDELFKYNMVALVDVDPYGMTMQEAMWISDFVASGGSLLLFGGPDTLGHATYFQPPLADILPVEIIRPKDLVKVDRDPVIGMPHPVTEGVPLRLGKISQAHQVRARLEAQVLLQAEDVVLPIAGKPKETEKGTLPILVAGKHGEGRVLVVNAHPLILTADQEDFFLSDFYDDLMVQGLAWLLRTPPPEIAVETFSPPPLDVLAGETFEVVMNVRPSGGRAGTVVCQYLREGKTVETLTEQVGPDKAEARFTVKAPPLPLGEESKDVLVLEARNAAGELQAVRTCSVTAHPEIELETDFRYNVAATQPGRQLRFQAVCIQWKDGTYRGLTGDRSIRARIIGPADEEIAVLPSHPLTGKAVEFAFDVPDLAQGGYRVVTELLEAEGSVSASSSRDFLVADPVDHEALFPTIAFALFGGAQPVTEEFGRRRVDDLLEHGINTVSAAAFVQNRSEWGAPRYATRQMNLMEAYALSKGMSLYYEYEDFTLAHRRSSVCVNSPDYPDYIRKRTARYMGVGEATPRLLGIKEYDEPFAYPDVIDYCEHCQAAWKARFGTEMRKLADIPADDRVGRRQYLEFLRDHVLKGYQTGHDIKEEANADWNLLLTFCYPSCGYSYSSLFGEHEDLLWAQAMDWIDIDVYPYLLPISATRFRFAQVHFCLALVRNVARHFGKPWGFYVEVNDSAGRLCIFPEEASSECALCALAQGVDFLDTFENLPFGSVKARAERWDQLGKTLKPVVAAGPLLNAGEEQRSKVALLFPNTHWMMAGGAWSHYAQWCHQMLLRSFGEADIIHEEVARREMGFGPCRALALMETQYLPDDIAEMIVDFVRNGGYLLCDNLPEFNELGQPCKLPKDLFGGEPAPFARNVQVAGLQYGKGRTFFFSPVEPPAEGAKFRLGLNILGVVKPPNEEGIEEFQAAFRRLLFEELKLRPLVHAENPEFETGCRVAGDGMVLTILNHWPEEASSDVSLFDPPFEVKMLGDSDGNAYELQKTEEGYRFRVSLPARDGRLFFAYPSVPRDIRVDLLTPELKPGEELRYRATLLDEEGKPCRGRFMIPVEVRDPRGALCGRCVPGGGLTSDGCYEAAAKLPVNAPRGEWRISVFAPTACRSAMKKPDEPRIAAFKVGTVP